MKDSAILTVDRTNVVDSALEVPDVLKPDKFIPSCSWVIREVV